MGPHPGAHIKPLCNYIVEESKNEPEAKTENLKKDKVSVFCFVHFAYILVSNHPHPHPLQQCQLWEDKVLDCCIQQIEDLKDIEV